MSTGDRYCYSCFKDRQNKATDTYNEDYGDKYWGVYCIPIVGLFAAIRQKIILFVQKIFLYIK